MRKVEPVPTGDHFHIQGVSGADVGHLSCAGDGAVAGPNFTLVGPKVMGEHVENRFTTCPVHAKGVERRIGNFERSGERAVAAPQLLLVTGKSQVAHSH